MAEYRVLYTHQKSKKHKTWHDGILRYNGSCDRKGILLDDSGSTLGALYVKSVTISVGEQYESDKYLISIEETNSEEKQCSSNSITAQASTSTMSMVVANRPTEAFQSTATVGIGEHHTSVKKRKLEIDSVCSPACGSYTCISGAPQAKKRSTHDILYLLKPTVSQTCVDETSLSESVFQGSNSELKASSMVDTSCQNQRSFLQPIIADQLETTQFQCSQFSGVVECNPTEDFISKHVREEVCEDSLEDFDKGVSFMDDCPSKPQQNSNIGKTASAESKKYPFPVCHRPVQPPMCGSLVFPSRGCVISDSTPSRQTVIPHTFTTAEQYKTVLMQAIREHLNIIMFDLAVKYHRACAAVDMSHSQPNSSVLPSCDSPGTSAPLCQHGPAHLKTVRKEGSNKGRAFYCCGVSGPSKCKFFQWADTSNSESAAKQLRLDSVSQIESYFANNRLSFHTNCKLVRKCMKTHPKQKSKYDARKDLFISLTSRRNIKSYSKDDLWVVSKDHSFDQAHSFVAKSVFYGPNSSDLVEIQPLSGCSPSNWEPHTAVCCLHVGNASTELTCLSNLEDNVSLRTMPILPHLLSLKSVSKLKTKSFVPPTRTDQKLGFDGIISFAKDLIAKYVLNSDQSNALLHCASMFAEDRERASPILLIHGVFGAGKSYLLTVIILLFVRVFEMMENALQRSCRTPQKLLISSTTNVAVDRILCGLLERGFEDFVRVGSVKKIAKPILPYSLRSDMQSQDLKELQDMMKSDIDANEKLFVKRAIEQYKLGVNKKLLSSVRVVGVTCAASSFRLMDGLVFSVLLLDECSQMTEACSLLPMARFGCEKAVLVGDPKQLAPTIQGSKAGNDQGLELTMFERLANMGHHLIMLKTQYRCHPVLSSISNTLFYGKQIINGVTECQREPLLVSLPVLCFLDVANGVEQCANDGSYMNKQEALVTVALLELIVSAFGIPSSSIGVITIYRGQMFMLQKIMLQQNVAMKAVQISTVDAFQGAEKEIIILSCVRTQNASFVDSERRMNVALTRAKRHLLIVGNKQVLAANYIWSHVISHCGSVHNGIETAENFLNGLKKSSEST